MRTCCALDLLLTSSVDVGIRIKPHSWMKNQRKWSRAVRRTRRRRIRAASVPLLVRYYLDGATAVVSANQYGTTESSSF